MRYGPRQEDVAAEELSCTAYKFNDLSMFDGKAQCLTAISTFKLMIQ